jgi:hypothetical protein
MVGYRGGFAASKILFFGGLPILQTFLWGRLR